MTNQFTWLGTVLIIVGLNVLLHFLQIALTI